MKVRKAKPGDAEDIDRVVQRTWIEAYQGVEPEGRLKEVQKMEEVMPHKELREWIKDNSTVYLVAEVKGDIVGEAIVVTDGDEDYVSYPEEAFLRSLYVLPEHHEEGIGTALLNKSIQVLPEKVERLKTMALEENSRGRAFYSKKGFQKKRRDNLRRRRKQSSGRRTPDNYTRERSRKE